jgi:hypothetical protein
MKMDGFPILGCTALLLISMAGSASAGKHKFVNFDVPGASGTFPLDINNNGDMAGSYWDVHQTSHGFIRMTDGTVKTFDVPGASSTDAGAINDSDEILGIFSDSTSVAHGFTRSPDGTITAFDPKGSTETDAIAINDKGEITGGYYDKNNLAHGFVRMWNGKFVFFDPDGALYTFGESINNLGVVAGAYCANGLCDPYNAFVRSPDGVITTFAVSGAKMTIPTDINSNGTIAGYFTTYDGVREGFLRDPGGQISEFACAWVTGLNNRGWVVGYNTDFYGNHGCLRAPDGTISTFDDPDGIDGYGTQPTSINRGRYVTGYYRDSNLVYHGFLVLPRK